MWHLFNGQKHAWKVYLVESDRVSRPSGSIWVSTKTLGRHRWITCRKHSMISTSDSIVPNIRVLHHPTVPYTATAQVTKVFQGWLEEQWQTMTTSQKYTTINMFCQNRYGDIYKLNLPCVFVFSEVALGPLRAPSHLVRPMISEPPFWVNGPRSKWEAPSVNLQNLGAILGVNLHLNRRNWRCKCRKTIGEREVQPHIPHKLKLDTCASQTFS